MVQSSDATRIDDTHPAFTFSSACENGHPETNDNMQYSFLKSGAIAEVAATRDTQFWFGIQSPALNQDPMSAMDMGYQYVHELTVDNLSAAMALATSRYWSGLFGRDYNAFKNKLVMNLDGDPEVSLSDSAASSPGPVDYCSGHGDCSDSGSCVCRTGYSGNDCSVTCPGGPTCSSHGTCNAGACTCSAGYTGASCSVNCGVNSSCPDGNACTGANQCATRLCSSGKCQPPACSPRCTQGSPCGASNDCGSQVCTNSTCAAPACSPSCTQSAVCGGSQDCASRVCTNNLCASPSCAPHCNQGSPCGSSSDCGSHVCTSGLCAPPACSPHCSAGSACNNNNDCISHNCSNNVCR